MKHCKLMQECTRVHAVGMGLWTVHLPVMARTSPTSPDEKLKPPSERELTAQSENIYSRECGFHQMVHHLPTLKAKIYSS